MDHGFSIKESQPVTRIGAFFDGKISLIDSSDRVVASFSTGSPICSHDLSNFECHWRSYSSDSDIGKKIVSLNAEYLVNRTPFISEEGVTFGSKKCTVFVVEAKTGTLIRTYPSSGFQSTEQTDGEKSSSAKLHLLYIRRTDYELHCTAHDSKKDLWRMKVVDIVYYHDPKNMEYELGPAINSAFKMPSADQSKVVSQRFQQVDDDATSRLYVFSRNKVAVVVLPLEKMVEANILPYFIYKHALVARGRKRKSHFEHLYSSVDGNAYWIGKIFVSTTVIAKGSNETIVFEGKFEDREVAVKRFVQDCHDLAFNEIDNLIASDGHPNIVRYHGWEKCKDFVYIALERCTCSLDDLIQINSNSEDQSSRDVIDKCRLDSVKRMMQDRKLWKANGHPSSFLLNLMRDMVSGLVHLHELGIIHQDLKPQNVLILFGKQSICAKISDMDISRRLKGSGSSLSCDLSSLGCVLFYCITLGGHPFGDSDQREDNIRDNKMDLSLLQNKDIVEAEHIIRLMLNLDPQLRPSAVQVLHHPLFWNPMMRLSFFLDTSERLVEEDRRGPLLRALESIASDVIGSKWNTMLDVAFNNDIWNSPRHCQGHRYRLYSVEDLLRYMRNKLSHFWDLPAEIMELVGGDKEGLFDYFASRFPRLLIEVYKVMYMYCRGEKSFQKYLESSVV